MQKMGAEKMGLPFQFQYGAIEGGSLPGNSGSPMPFQFQYGAIEGKKISRD